MEFFQEYHIVIIGCLFMAIVSAMVFLTWKDKQWVKANFAKDQIVALGFGITCFGLTSEKGSAQRHKGLLLVHSKGLLFKTRFSNFRIDIPGQAITKVYHGDTHKGSKLYRAAVMIDFVSKEKKTDSIAFKIAYPAQWIKIIGKTFDPKFSEN